MREVRRALPLFRLAIAVRTAVAVMVAWFIGNQMCGDLTNYAYAAPLGAFVAVGTTVFTIGRTALQHVIGMTGGALLGLLTLQLEWNGVLEIGLIGAVAVLLHGVPHFNQGATVVPVVAVLVILFGGADPDGYAIGYVGQFALGMGVGVIVNALVLPALYDKETRRQIRAAVTDLASRVDVLADTMRGDWPPERDDWADWGPELRRGVDRLDHQVREAREARRFNVRMLWNQPQSGLASVVFAMRAMRERIDWAVSQDPEA